MASLSSRCLAEGVGTLLLVYFGTGAAVITLLLAAGTKPATAFNVGIGQLGGLETGLRSASCSGSSLRPSSTRSAGYRGAYQPGGNHRPLGDKAVPVCGYGCLRHRAVHRCRGRKSAPVPDSRGRSSHGRGARGDRTVPGDRYGQAILVEAIATFVLMLVIMGVAVDPRATPGFAGLIIGLTVAGMITMAGNITGSAINPARTFGPYLMDGLLGGCKPLGVLSRSMSSAPLCGAVAAAFFYDRIASA